MEQYEWVIQGKAYKIDFENNRAAEELTTLFPLSVEMKDLNGNEKFCYLPKPLTEQPKSMKEIKKGDVMLYGPNCLVLFYKDFTTRYAYTRLGKVVDFDESAATLGQENSQVQIHAVH